MISGVLFGLFSGQPLIIVGSTGPVYVFEKILYQICTDQNWDYLSLRLWIGIWIGLILILLVLVDASAYVCYITRYSTKTRSSLKSLSKFSLNRFTEELFATLIAFIFIFNAFKNVADIGSKTKFVPTTDDLSCYCDGNDTERLEFYGYTTWTNVSRSECATVGGSLVRFGFME